MKYRMAAALLSLAGLFVSIYLYLYKLGRIGSLVCGTGDCEKVQTSRYSQFMGVDVALLGIIAYAALLVLALAALQPAHSRSGRLSTATVMLAGAGVTFAAYLTYLELFVIHAICRWCVASAILITTIFIALLLDRRRLRAPIMLNA